MRYTAIAAALAAVIGFAGAASAETIQGTVSSYDAATQQLMLQSGEAFRLQSGIDAAMLTSGMQVTLNVENIGGQSVVTEVEAN